MEAIIEKLLLIKDEQILMTPLEELDLSIRVHRSLWRGRVRTIGDLARTWRNNPPVRNIGERARREILGALQAWSLSIPNFTNLDRAEMGGNVPGCDPRQAMQTPIEALHLSPRTYRALKRNKIETLDDILQGWDKIASIRIVGRKSMDEIRTALEAFHPNHGSELAGNDPANGRPAANVVGYETINEIPTKKHVITESGAVVDADLLQAGEPRRSREERWKNVSPGRVSAKPEDYAPKNIFQAIGTGPDKIYSPIRTGPIRRRKKTPDGSGRKYASLLSKLLETLEKANRRRKVRNVTCPLCRTVMKSIQFEAHLVDMHPGAFQELQNAVSGSLGWQKVPGVGLVFREPRETNPFVKCPLCDHRARYRVMNIHIQASHSEVDPGLVIGRFHRVNRSKNYKNLLRYKQELNELIKEYERLKQAQEEPRDGS